MRDGRLTTIFSAGVAALLLLAGSNLETARGQDVVAPDVVVFCEPTLLHAILDVGALWQRESGIPVRVFASPSDMILEQVPRRPRNDVIIAEGKEAEEAARQQGLVKPGSPFAIGRNRLVVAELRAEASRITAPGNSDLQKLVGTGSFAIVDPSVASTGAETQAMLDHLGLSKSLEGHSTGVISTTDAAFLLTTRKVRFAIIYKTDVIADPRLSVAAELPSDAGPLIEYWAAESVAAMSPNTTQFLTFLRQPAAKAQLRTDGMDVP